MRNITRDIDEEIAKVQEKLDALRQEKERLDMMPEDQRLAEHLHEMKCTWNHDDGCSWYYEKSYETGRFDWTEYTHQKWLHKAQALLQVADYSTIVKIAKTL